MMVDEMKENIEQVNCSEFPKLQLSIGDMHLCVPLLDYKNVDESLEKCAGLLLGLLNNKLVRDYLFLSRTKRTPSFVD